MGVFRADLALGRIVVNTPGESANAESPEDIVP
jgi:hypothetical protein